MDPIDQSAKKIADIIGVIDGIAFPTNILALNAAVEADCAGEQSRGIEHVNQALVQMGQVTQQNAALVEQAAADSMKDQADHLAQVIGVFTLAPGGGARA